MPKDLKHSVNQTRDVESQIRASLQTPIKRSILWIITESDYDSRVYERFFNDNVAVRPSYDEKGKGGCKRVERIVKNILKTGETNRIVGIRDADYVYFLPVQFKSSTTNIFHTDERDIEMMMIKSPSVRAALTAWDATFDSKIDQVIPIACYMGKIRIWHVARNKTADLKKYHIACAWDQNSKPQKPVAHWKKVLIERYSRITGEHLNEYMVTYIRRCYRLDDTKYGRICRGHDFVQILGLAMIDTRFSGERLHEKIAESYAVADFAQTALARSIVAFANQYGMTVM